MKTRKTISTTEILPLWPPFFSAKKSSTLEQGSVCFLFLQRGVRKGTEGGRGGEVEKGRGKLTKGGGKGDKGGWERGVEKGTRGVLQQPTQRRATSLQLPYRKLTRREGPELHETMPSLPNILQRISWIEKEKEPEVFLYKVLQSPRLRVMDVRAFGSRTPTQRTFFSALQAIG